MRVAKITRRGFLLGSLLAGPALVCADAYWVEPRWIKVRRIRLGKGTGVHRVVHITDIHYRGDRAYLESVVRKINALAPELVCFTGDLIEEAVHLPEALEILAKIKSPLYGVPGNHDYWAKMKFDSIAEVFAKTGGAWLMDKQAVTGDGKIHVSGATCSRQIDSSKFVPRPGCKNILLLHYPLCAEQFRSNRYDLLLAGHSHGGQVRVPFYGSVLEVFGVGRYDVGLFETPCGPLYVNPGLGWFATPIRFMCRPEITVLEI